MKLDFDVVFGNTITSYNPDENGISSGKSGSDVERILAFDSIGRKDPIQYQDSWETVLSNAKKELLRHYVMKENEQSVLLLVSTTNISKEVVIIAQIVTNYYSHPNQNSIQDVVGLHLVRKTKMQT